MRSSSKVFCSTRPSSSTFCQREPWRKVVKFNALETFHDNRKELESVLFIYEEFLHKKIEKGHVFIDLTEAMNIPCSETVYSAVARI